MFMKKFYVTTPIYYPNDKLHIGHAYTTVAADALARYHRLRGEDVFFLTGMDEHGQKIADRAAAEGVSPQVFVDRMAEGIRALWAALRISYDDFIRTTEPRHERTVQEVFRRLLAQGDIYLGRYEGWYCTACESYWTETKLVEGRCPVCSGPVSRLQEESYFFRLGRYADRLLQHIETHPQFLQPESRRNEMVAFIRQGLEDLSVTRTGFDWGVKLPEAAGHVAYVWIDALTNYITAAGYPDDPERFARYWPADVQLVGKEIVRFHAIIWCIMLMALGLELPERIFGHGWLVLSGEKMSKSRGNVVDPVVLVERYGVDAVRYFLLREVPFGADGTYSEAALRLRTNVDLANDLGNLLSRTTAMIERFAQGKVPAPRSSELRAVAEAALSEYERAMGALELSGALEAVGRMVAAANKHIETAAPWTLSRKGDPRLGDVLYDLAEVLRVAAVALSPALVEAPAEIWRQLGVERPVSEATWDDVAWGGLVPGTRVRRGAPLFPRIEAEERSEPAAAAAAEDERIPIEDVRRVKLVVATVLEARRVEGAERLLELVVDLGSERRTIVSGIAADYAPEALVGGQIVLVKNLKPSKIRGVRSDGMLLATSEAGHVVLLRPDRAVPAGSPVS